MAYLTPWLSSFIIELRHGLCHSRQNKALYHFYCRIDAGNEDFSLRRTPTAHDFRPEGLLAVIIETGKDNIEETDRDQRDRCDHDDVAGPVDAVADDLIPVSQGNQLVRTLEK